MRATTAFSERRGRLSAAELALTSSRLTLNPAAACACVSALFTTERARSIITTFIHPSIRPVCPSSLSCPSQRARVALSNLPTHDPKRISKLPAAPSRFWDRRRRRGSSGGRSIGDGSATGCDGRQINAELSQLCANDRRFSRNCLMLKHSSLTPLHMRQQYSWPICAAGLSWR